MLSSKLISVVALLVVGGPVLVFPDLLPATWRTSVVTLITLAALGFGLVLLQPWKGVRWGLWLFLLAVVASWAVMPVHDLLGLRHFAGVGVGVLAMAGLATWCTTTDRLITATLLFALASTGVLILGALNTFITNAKFITGPAGSIWSTPAVPWLPQIMMGLPGLESTEGQVNQNALGGTALMLVPTCAGLAAAAFIGGRRRHLMLVAGGVATTVAVAVLGRTLSRTAWISAVLTLVALALRWRRGRYWVLAALLVATAGLGFTVHRLRPADFDDGIRSARSSVLARVAIWQDGVDRLREAPWLGVGINQFHEVTPTAAAHGASRVAHAHNMLLQVALDVGLLGLSGYVLLLYALLLMADRAARRPDMVGRIAAGAGFSLVGVHLFGLGDTIALGAKVGIFQWLCAGLILAASHLPPSAPDGRNGSDTS